jgi:hypothetical protein
MISLEKTVFNAIQKKKNNYEKLSVELAKLDTRNSTEKYLYSSLVKRMVKLNEELKPLMKKYEYLKSGCGIQEDNF